MSKLTAERDGRSKLRRASQPIVLACDERYVMPPLASALRSIAESHTGREPLEFHVLATGIADSTKLKGPEVASRWWSVDPLGSHRPACVFRVRNLPPRFEDDVCAAARSRPVR